MHGMVEKLWNCWGEISIVRLPSLLLNQNDQLQTRPQTDRASAFVSAKRLAWAGGVVDTVNTFLISSSILTQYSVGVSHVVCEHKFLGAGVLSLKMGHG